MEELVPVWVPLLKLNVTVSDARSCSVRIQFPTCPAVNALPLAVSVTVPVVADGVMVTPSFMVVASK